MNRKVLGRGLSDLFIDKVSLIQSDHNTTANINQSNNSQHSITELNLSLIKPCHTQPRKIFEEDSLNELAASIKENGVLQPIIVRKINNSNEYEIIAGERRWRASQIANQKTIPVIIKEINDHQAFLISIIENLQRSNLSPIEEAEVYQRLVNDGYTHDQIASMINKSRSYISNSTRLIHLTEKVKNLVNQKILSVGHGKILLTNGIDENDQNDLAEQIIKKHLNTKQSEELIKKFLDNKKDDNIDNLKNFNIEKQTQKPSYDLQEVAQLLEESLETKVSITGRQINIDYKNIVDLDRLLSLLIK